MKKKELLADKLNKAEVLSATVNSTAYPSPSSPKKFFKKNKENIFNFSEVINEAQDFFNAHQNKMGIELLQAIQNSQREKNLKETAKLMMELLQIQQEDGFGQIHKCMQFKLFKTHYIIFDSGIDNEARRHESGRVCTKEALQKLIDRLEAATDKEINNTDLKQVITHLDDVDVDDILQTQLGRMPKLGDPLCKKITGVEIDRKTLAKWYHLSKKPRSPSQSSVMKISPNRYAQALNLKGKFEWAHLAAHSFGGPDGKNPQVEKNLVLVSAGCNTWMMVAETLVRFLLKQKGIESITISIHATLIPHTHVAQKIDYMIWHQDKEIMNFHFNALKQDAPPYKIIPMLEKMLEDYLKREEALPLCRKLF